MELFRDNVFETVLEIMEDRFDSHDFIFEMMRQFPREYTIALYECRRSKDPIQTLHAKIGRKLSEMGQGIVKTNRSSSINTRGLHSRNQHWEKTKSEEER